MFYFVKEKNWSFKVRAVDKTGLNQYNTAARTANLKTMASYHKAMT